MEDDQNLDPPKDGMPRIRVDDDPWGRGVLLRPNDPPDQRQFVLSKQYLPVGEEDVKGPCQQLVELFNSTGQNYSPAERFAGQEEGVDCISFSSQGDLRFQVTKAWHNPSFFQGVRTQNAVAVTTDVSQIILDLLNAVRSKAEKYPSELKRDLILVLDARDVLPYHDRHLLGQVFRSHGKELVTFGFKAIWSIGILEPPIRIDWPQWKG